MDDAIDAYEDVKNGKTRYDWFCVAYVITNEGEESNAYEDCDGNIYGDYYSIELP